MRRFLPAAIILSLLLMPVSTGGSVVPAGPFASTPQYIGRFDLPECNCGLQDVSAKHAVLTFTSGKKWEFTIKYGDTIFYITFIPTNANATDDRVTLTEPGKVTLTQISPSQSDPLPKAYPGKSPFNVTFIKSEKRLGRGKQAKSIKSITIEEDGGCMRDRHDLFCFSGHV